MRVVDKGCRGLQCFTKVKQTFRQMILSLRPFFYSALRPLVTTDSLLNLRKRLITQSEASFAKPLDIFLDDPRELFIFSTSDDAFQQCMELQLFSKSPIVMASTIRGKDISHPFEQPFDPLMQVWPGHPLKVKDGSEGF